MSDKPFKTEAEVKEFFDDRLDKMKEKALGQDPLHVRMLRRADEDFLPEGHPLRIRALQFVEACNGYFAKEQTVKPLQFLGSWARARRAWSDYTGEAFVDE